MQFLLKWQKTRKMRSAAKKILGHFSHNCLKPRKYYSLSTLAVDLAQIATVTESGATMMAWRVLPRDVRRRNCGSGCGCIGRWTTTPVSNKTSCRHTTHKMVTNLPNQLQQLELPMQASSVSIPLQQIKVFARKLFHIEVLSHWKEDCLVQLKWQPVKKLREKWREQ